MAAAKGDEAKGEATGEADAKPKGSKKKLILLALPLVLGGAGAGVWFSGILSPPPSPPAEAAAEPAPVNRQPVFVSMPDITANLNAPGRRAFIRVRSQVEVAGPQDAATLQAAMPRLVDLFTTYLREIRPEELRGSAGTHRLREELIARANIAAAPARVTDVLFTDPRAMSGSEEEDMAAAWGAALAEEEAAPQVEAAPDAARVLNQAEIDSLLGFEGGTGDDAGKTGVERMILSGLVSYERLPMLEIIFDRLVRILSTSLRNFTSDNVEVSIDSVASQRFGDYLNSVPLPAMLAVFKVAQWDNFGLIIVDSSMIYSVVDVLLGGRRGTAAMRIEGRPYTTIERTLVERLIGVVLRDLGEAFAPITNVEFVFERLEVNPRFATISRLSNGCVLTRLRIDMEDRGGRLELLLPYATLEPVRELLLQQFMGEKFGRDSIWETHLAEQLRHTDISLDVVLDEQVMPLSSVIALKPGDRIILNAPPGSAVKLQCGSVPLFTGEFGRRENRPAVRISESLGNVGELFT